VCKVRFFFGEKLDQGSPVGDIREDSKEGEFEGLDADADSLEQEEEDLKAEAEEDRLEDLREDEEMLDREEELQAQEDELVELEDARLVEQSQLQQEEVESDKQLYALQDEIEAKRAAWDQDTNARRAERRSRRKEEAEALQRMEEKKQRIEDRKRIREEARLKKEQTAQEQARRKQEDLDRMEARRQASHSGRKRSLEVSETPYTNRDSIQKAEEVDLQQYATETQPQESETMQDSPGPADRVRQDTQESVDPLMEENQLDLFGESNISDGSPWRDIPREKDRVGKIHKQERAQERKRAREQKDKDEEQAKSMAKKATLEEKERIRAAREASSPGIRKGGDKRPELGLE
jgi:hypothetical protein